MFIIRKTILCMQLFMVCLSCIYASGLTGWSGIEHLLQPARLELNHNINLKGALYRLTLHNLVYFVKYSQSRQNEISKNLWKGRLLCRSALALVKVTHFFRTPSAAAEPMTLLQEQLTFYCNPKRSEHLHNLEFTCMLVCKDSSNFSMCPCFWYNQLMFTGRDGRIILLRILAYINCSVYGQVHSSCR